MLPSSASSRSAPEREDRPLHTGLLRVVCFELPQNDEEEDEVSEARQEGKCVCVCVFVCSLEVQIDVDLPIFGPYVSYCEVRYRWRSELADVPIERAPALSALDSFPDLQQWIGNTYHV